MELAITKMSPNGQVVIPAEIRAGAGLKQGARFLVFQERGVVVLKELRREQFAKDLALVVKLARAEEQIRKGESIMINSRTPAKEAVRKLDAYGRRVQR